jgi:hypothetical protein
MKLCIAFLISMPMFLCSCTKTFFTFTRIPKTPIKKHIPQEILLKTLNLDVRANALSDFYDVTVINSSFARNEICAANAAAAYINKTLIYNLDFLDSFLSAVKSLEFIQGDNFLDAINDDGYYVYGFSECRDYDTLANLANALSSIKCTALILDIIVSNIFEDSELVTKASIDIGSDPIVLENQPTSRTFNENVNLAIAKIVGTTPNSTEYMDFTPICDLISNASIFAMHASNYLAIIKADPAIINTFREFSLDLENLSCELSMLSEV